MDAELKVWGANSDSVDWAAEGVLKKVRAFRDGTISTAAWIQAMIVEGLGYGSFEGAFSTPAAGGGAAAIIDIDRPRVTVGVPDGTTMIPYRIHGQAQLPLIVTDSDESEILFGVHVGTKIAVVAATEVKPRNLKTGVQSGSALDFQITHTTNIATAPTVDIELARKVAVGDVQGTAANANWGILDLLYEPRYVEFIKGPGTLLVYRGGTVATTGFTQVRWIEIKTALLA